ncbi:pyridoxamine 5'-phosphate oxidase family protein [Candidatus Hecatella orcuttiae]|jgi:nitroimidazol reductase NimA-like FMN-containing flavoprotein (pyridoxamine 5'-phosphate oxidase superfamily)|uniref:pyridoxamine 5'-phosphate oxidase family protein n=1 Tax=Candidatus Hecatella orcuttiae TaxID=1935119 RepID=UPI002867D984|nr:pyridoxamine 5'-phosphate oxidase family protein [Candidatus Hecatella orcuttiae]
MSEEEIRRVMEEILQGCKVCTLATESGGKPWATTMFFAVKGTNFYCIVENRGHGMANLKKNPHVALAIDNRVPDRFVQAAGTAEVVEGEEEAEGRKLVLDRVPEYRPFFEMVTTSLVRIVPKEIHVTDVPRGWFPAKVLRL